MTREINQKGIDLIKRFEGYVPFVYLCQAGKPTIGYGHLCRNSDNYMPKDLDVEAIRKTIERYPDIIAYGGMNLKSNTEIKEKTIISEEEIECLLRDDLEEACKAVNDLVSVPLTDNQFSALVSFTFNLSKYNLARSTLRKKLNKGDYDSVPSELNKWVWAGGFQLEGLIKRRREEGRLFNGK